MFQWKIHISILESFPGCLLALPEVVCGEDAQDFQGNQGVRGSGFLFGDDDGDYLPGEEAVSAFGGVLNLAGGCLGRLPLASKGVVGVVHPPCPWALVVVDRHHGGVVAAKAPPTHRLPVPRLLPPPQTSPSPS